jgi:hypothetical protein
MLQQPCGCRGRSYVQGFPHPRFIPSSGRFRWVSVIVKNRRRHTQVPARSRGEGKGREAGIALAFHVPGQRKRHDRLVVATEEFCSEQRFLSGPICIHFGKRQRHGKEEGSRLAARLLVPASADKGEDPADFVLRDPIAQSARNEPGILLAVSGQSLLPALYMAIQRSDRSGAAWMSWFTPAEPRCHRR